MLLPNLFDNEALLICLLNAFGETCRLLSKRCDENEQVLFLLAELIRGCFCIVLFFICYLCKRIIKTKGNGINEGIKRKLVFMP